MNPSSALAGVLVDELVRLGVTDAVLCPGSRSAPLAYALAAADAAGRLRLHVRVDERSAAFLALGLAKLTDRPAPVVTTSGTAVANLFPAVLEAHEAGVPMLVLTADRPPELRRTGANQTTDQVGIFGASVRWAHDLGVPETRAGQQAVWRTTADRAYAASVGSLGALGGPPGPVHLNVPFRDPLVPDVDGPDAAEWIEPLAGRADGTPWTSVVPLVRPDWPMSASVPDPGVSRPSRLRDVERTLVLLGDAPAAALHLAVRVADAAGYPVVAEPFGELPSVDGAEHTESTRLPHGSMLARTDLVTDPALRPDRLLVVGRLTLTRTVAAILRTPGLRVESVSADPQWPDPGHVVQLVHPWGALLDLARSVPSPRCHDRDPGDPTTFAGAWRAAALTAAAALRPVLEESWPSGPSVADALLAALPDFSVLFVGSSNGVRDLDVTRSGDRACIVASRGLAGIDGCISTSVGIALARPGRPTYALLGDLTFVHDTNGLLIGPHESRPDLTVVVVNDDGGGIFMTLEYGDPARLATQRATFERVFATPTSVDLAALCAAHGVPHELVDSRAGLAAAVGRAPAGLRVVEVRVSRERHREVYGRMREAVRAALTPPVPTASE